MRITGVSGERLKLLQDMMKRPNVIFILGNHDFVMYSLMRTLAVEITEENYDKKLTADIMRDFNLWLSDGGRVTAEQFRKLDPLEMSDILDYIAGASLYEVIEHNGKEYRLVHAGISDFAPEKTIRLLEYLKKHTDREHFLRSVKNVQKEFNDKGLHFGSDNTIRDFYRKIANAYNLDEYQHPLPQSQWRIVYDGYVKLYGDGEEEEGLSWEDDSDEWAKTEKSSAIYIMCRNFLMRKSTR